MKAGASALLFALLAGAIPGQAQKAVSTSVALPPVSWTCLMHPEVVEDKKGECPQCKMELVPVRLVTVWTCPVHAVIEQEQPGKCRICARTLVQATRALTFTCAGHPEISRIEPGPCGDGTPAIAKYTPRPHGDHNPKHGGLFFMAPDNWHHVEGAYPAAGRFRVYLYDDYTKPLTPANARKVRGRIVTKEVFDPATRTAKELASAPLVLARNGAYLEATIEPLALPAQMTAKISFGPDDKENRFDFSFPAFSKDTAAPPAPASAPAAVSTAMTAANAAGGPTAALLTELKARDQEVAGMVKSGVLGAIYVPALQAKDLALQIQARQVSAPAQQRQALEAEVKRLVVAAYQIDNYGDLGDAQKINEVYRDFSAAVAAISAQLGSRP
jgi:Heavy metal binding domain